MGRAAPVPMASCPKESSVTAESPVGRGRLPGGFLPVLRVASTSASCLQGDSSRATVSLQSVRCAFSQTVRQQHDGGSKHNELHTSLGL